MDHRCLYCGKEITKEDLLFVRDSSDQLPDARRQTMLTRCWSEWPFAAYADADRKIALFNGRYYRPLGAEARYCRVEKTDPDGYPLLITINYDFFGLSPEELEVGVRRPSVPGAKPRSRRSEDAIIVDDEVDTLRNLNVAPDPYADTVAPETEPALFPTLEEAEQPYRLTMRACPHCHMPLPVHFGQLETISVALMGGRAAGKTAFLIALEHSLNSVLSERRLGSVQLLPPSKEFYTIQNAHAQNHDGAPMATPMRDRLFPFVYQYTSTTDSTKKCFVSIMDIAGEGMHDPNYLANNTGLSNADILLIMLDPNMLTNGDYAKSAAEGGAAPAYADVSHECCAETLDEFFSQHVAPVTSMDVMSNVRHVIAVTTKIDLPLTQTPQLFVGDCELKNNMAAGGQLQHVGGYDKAILRRMQKMILRYYNHPHLSAGSSFAPDECLVNNLIENALPGCTIRHQAVSVRTMAPLDHPDATPVFMNIYDPNDPNGKKHRVAEPFLLILAIKGMIPWLDSEDDEDEPRREKKEKKRGLFGWLAGR